MPLLTIENLKTEQAKAGAIVAGFLGLLAVAVTNIDKLMDAYRYFTERVEATEAKGPWLGVYREYDSGQKAYITSTESVNLTSSRDHISGTIDSPAPLFRHHEISGNVKDGFLIAEYRDGEPTRAGATVYLLNGRVQSGTLLGFWTGYDPDERAVMSCPYVMTRQTDPVAVQSQFKDWLNKNCAR